MKKDCKSKNKMKKMIKINLNKSYNKLIIKLAKNNITRIQLKNLIIFTKHFNQIKFKKIYQKYSIKISIKIRKRIMQ